MSVHELGVSVHELGVSVHVRTYISKEYVLNRTVFTVNHHSASHIRVCTYIRTYKHMHKHMYIHMHIQA